MSDLDLHAIPRIRLEIEGMKSAIIHHLGVEGSKLGSIMASEIDNAVASFNWHDAVAPIVQKAIRDAVNSYFTYGSGGVVIRTAVDTAMDNALRNEEKEFEQ